MFDLMRESFFIFSLNEESAFLVLVGQTVLSTIKSTSNVQIVERKKNEKKNVCACVIASATSAICFQTKIYNAQFPI